MSGGLEAVVERIRNLRPGCTFAQIAQKLNDEGFRSAKGKAFDTHTVGYIVRSRGWGRNNGNGRAKSIW